MKKKVSIIVPTYERNEFLERAVKSILEQSYSNLEVIVVDDNLDNSAASKQVVDTINSIGDKRIIYIKTAGKTGGGAARNLGLKFITGDYVAFLDDDDVYLENKIFNQVRFMEENKLDFSFQDVFLYSTDERLVEFRKLDFCESLDKETLIKKHILHSIAPTSVYMATNQMISKSKGFGEVKVGQDFFFFFNCIEAGGKFGYMPGAYVKQYLHNQGRISLGKNKIEGENFLYEFKKKYFYLLKCSEKRYVKFRHMAVLAFTYYRSGKKINALFRFALTFLYSPINSIKESKKYFGNRRKQKH